MYVPQTEVSEFFNYIFVQTLMILRGWTPVALVIQFVYLMLHQEVDILRINNFLMDYHENWGRYSWSSEDWS